MWMYLPAHDLISTRDVLIPVSDRGIGLFYNPNCCCDSSSGDALYAFCVNRLRKPISKNEILVSLNVIFSIANYFVLIGKIVIFRMQNLLHKFGGGGGWGEYSLKFCSMYSSVIIYINKLKWQWQVWLMRWSEITGTCVAGVNVAACTILDPNDSTITKILRSLKSARNRLKYIWSLWNVESHALDRCFIVELYHS